MKYAFTTALFVAAAFGALPAAASSNDMPRQVSFNPDAPDSVVCRHMPRAGTSPQIDGRIVCLSNRDWERARRDAQDQVNIVQRRAMMKNP